jgi:Domain of unknown function (DUF4902)
MRHEGISPDRYVRIPTSALFSVQLRHLLSEKDGTVSVPAGSSAATAMTGITEWVGSWHNQAVSVGWDWGVVNGLVVLLSQNEIRTNIQLTAADHSPVPPCVAQIHLFHWIESLPWRQLAINDLLKGA